MMQLATQREFKSGGGPPATAGGSDKKSKRSARARTIAAIHITWAKLRRDLKGDKDELRESRLQFMSQVLKREVKSSRDLTQSKLGKVLDAMRELERAPLLPGAQASLPAVSLPLNSRLPALDAGRMPALPADIVHLATESQTATISKLFEYLGWTLETIEGFTEKRFKVKSHRMLTPEKANSLTMVLFTIAASRDIKRRTNFASVSRVMIRAEIPALKRRLGIDQQSEPPAHDTPPLGGDGGGCASRIAGGQEDDYEVDEEATGWR